MSKFLFYEDRMIIAQRLQENASFGTIGKELGKDRTTIAKEIKKYSYDKGYCILAYPCQVRRISRHTFAYRKTAVQVFPYGGRLFICRTSRCVCRCGPASAPEHHPLCDR